MAPARSYDAMRTALAPPIAAPRRSGPPDERRLARERVAARVIRCLAIYSAAVVALIAIVVLLGSRSSRDRAILLMALGLLLLWVALGGVLTLRYRDRVRAWLRSLRIRWEWRFFLLATFFVLLEEAVTTTMTNLAPEFGSQVGVAYITASNNYLLVIGFSSVVVIVPEFAGWVLLLRRYDFTANEVFLRYGLLGTTMEASLDPVALVAGFWFFVYGLMVYLPAYALPRRPEARTPRGYHYLLAYLLPLACALPVVVAVNLLRGILGIHLYSS